MLLLARLLEGGNQVTPSPFFKSAWCWKPWGCSSGSGKLAIAGNPVPGGAAADGGGCPGLTADADGPNGAAPELVALFGLTMFGLLLWSTIFGYVVAAGSHRRPEPDAMTMPTDPSLLSLDGCSDCCCRSQP